jgi:hypothetical protein
MVSEFENSNWVFELHQTVVRAFKELLKASEWPFKIKAYL